MRYQPKPSKLNGITPSAVLLDLSYPESAGTGFTDGKVHRYIDIMARKRLVECRCVTCGDIAVIEANKSKIIHKITNP